MEEFQGLTAFCSISLAYFVITGCLTYIRRAKQPLKVRSQWLMHLTTGSLILLMISKLANIANLTSCNYKIACSFINGELFNTTFMSIILREYRLVKIFNFRKFVTKNISEKQTTKFQKEISNKQLFMILGIEMIIHIIIFAWQTFGTAVNDGTLTCTSPTTNVVVSKLDTALAVANLVGFSIIIFYYGMLMIRQPSDIFYLKQELIVAAIIGLITWPIILAISYTDPNSAIQVNYLIVFNFDLLHFCVVTFPLIQTFLPKPYILSYGPVKGINDVLDHEDLKQIFMKTLIRELAHENLMFYNEMEDLTKADNEKKPKLATEIIRKYIKEGAALQINLDDRVQKKCLEGIQNDQYDALYDAQAHVLEILTTDCYPRFFRSQEFKEWVSYKKHLDASLFPPDESDAYFKEPRNIFFAFISRITKKKEQTPL